MEETEMGGLAAETWDYCAALTCYMDCDNCPKYMCVPGQQGKTTKAHDPECCRI